MTRIQKTFRMWKCRQEYLRYRESHVPTQDVLKTKYCLEKMSKFNNLLFDSVSESNQKLDALLSHLDRQISLTAVKKNASKMWKVVFEKTRTRGSDDCPICLQKVVLPKTIEGSLSRKIYLLSCSHAVHCACLKTLERFQQIDPVFKCPICREEYKRKTLG